MISRRTIGKRLATSSQFALVVFLTLGFATNTHESVANTLFSVKTTVAVAAPSKEDLDAAARAARLDREMGALSEQQAAYYRVVFALQARGDWARADALLHKLSDRRLLGHVFADRFEKRGASPQELESWLRAYPTLPEAESLYKEAKAVGLAAPTKPKAPEAWHSGGETDSAANFTPDFNVAFPSQSALERQTIRSVRVFLRKGDAQGAEKYLEATKQKGVLSEDLRLDLQAMIAASYLNGGHVDRALALSKAAAKANRPQGLWVRGLAAWRQDDVAQAKRTFARLVENPALEVNNRSAAAFWAYRATLKEGDQQKARYYLRQASRSPQTFYGRLAAQQLGENPASSLGDEETSPKWDQKARAIIEENQAGWRALALIQVGQIERAESELRRLDVVGDLEKQRALLALARYVSLPALILQVAHLQKQQEFDPSLYPVLPWAPKGGFTVDRALLFALARQESLFNPNAESVRGAQGLLQIMPATARGMVKDQPEALEMVGQNKLFDPSFNMALGQKYVQHLANRPKIGNNLVMLLASYNAGPTKVLSWQGRHNTEDPLLFMETIPVQETRHYVARVLSHYWAYRVRLGKEVPSLKQMAAGQWPLAPLDEEKAVQVATAY